MIWCSVVFNVVQLATIYKRRAERCHCGTKPSWNTFSYAFTIYLKKKISYGLYQQREASYELAIVFGCSR